MNQGRTDEAAEAINEVRLRAKASKITGAQVTKDFLADERIRELIGEEMRRFTLCRLGLLKERVLRYIQMLLLVGTINIGYGLFRKMSSTLILVVHSRRIRAGIKIIFVIMS